MEYLMLFLRAKTLSYEQFWGDKSNQDLER